MKNVYILQVKENKKNSKWESQLDYYTSKKDAEQDMKRYIYYRINKYKMRIIQFTRNEK